MEYDGILSQQSISGKIVRLIYCASGSQVYSTFCVLPVIIKSTVYKISIATIAPKQDGSLSQTVHNTIGMYRQYWLYYNRDYAGGHFQPIFSGVFTYTGDFLAYIAVQCSILYTLIPLKSCNIPYSLVFM